MIEKFKLSNLNKDFRVFVMEDDQSNRQLIKEELKDYNVQFFSKDNSVFELMDFAPDILVQDYFKNKVVECYRWS